jgi:ParB-like chromosome segregation protein Spo0J
MSVALPPEVIDRQPVARVEWIDPGTLKANSYNPNHVAPIELELLKTSILEDGWTQPIVARENGEIVDGFHRYLLAISDPEIAGLVGGLVPVVRLRNLDDAHQMMSTIRHNRARGSHSILRMSDIVQNLAEAMKVPAAEIQKRLGMEDEELERLLDTAGMTKRGAGETFNNGWTV